MPDARNLAVKGFFLMLDSTTIWLSCRGRDCTEDEAATAAAFEPST